MAFIDAIKSSTFSNHYNDETELKMKLSKICLST